MLSRVADAIYWASRYVERAENVARFVDVNLNLMLDAPNGQRPSWEPLVQTSGDQEYFKKRYGEATKEAVTHFLTFDRDYPNSILSALSYARENAQTVREVISREMWRELNSLYLFVKDTAATKGSASPEEMIEFYNRVKLAGIYYEGVTDATLSRGEAWYFARLGRMLERADKTSRILDVKYFILLPTTRDIGTTTDQVGWSALLNSASALQMYRQRYHVLAPSNVAEFLLLDRDFPRSIHYCLLSAQDSLHKLSGTPHDRHSNPAERLIGQLRARLDYADIEQVMTEGLHEYLDELQSTLNEIGQAVDVRFFHPAW
ncbi:MAG TPA: alpha-E domain-containing protein [Polyangiaceae bacterium]|nr:alpha-E domain-containing protein [Polyangiaceae bacterium]